MEIDCKLKGLPPPQIKVYSQFVFDKRKRIHQYANT